MAQRTSGQELHRRTIPEANDEDIVLEKLEVTKDDGNWFSFMVSYPLKKHMSQVELFTQWSALLVYFPVSTLSIYMPVLLAAPFQIQTDHYGTGLASLSGVHLAVIAFLYCIFSRTEPHIPSVCIILATTFERIVLVSGYCYMIYQQELLPTSFLLALSGADIGLSVITICIWYCSAEVSVYKYFNCLSQVISFRFPKLNYSSSAVQFLGLLQFVAASFFIAFPNFANQILLLNEIHGHQRGLASAALLGLAAVGFVNYCCGAADSTACNIATAFYRLTFTMPYVLVANSLQRIPFGLAAFLLCNDVISVLVILATLFMDRKLV